MRTAPVTFRECSADDDATLKASGLVFYATFEGAMNVAFQTDGVIASELNPGCFWARRRSRCVRISSRSLRSNMPSSKVLS